MKAVWLVALGLVIGISVSSFHSTPPVQTHDRDAVLLSREDLDQLSRAIDGLGRSDGSQIFHYEATSPSLLSLECSPGAETTCRLETRSHQTFSRGKAPVNHGRI